MNEKEIDVMAEGVKKLYEQKIREFDAKEYQREVNTDFDKLRKRVAYLSYNRKKPKPIVSANMQIHDKFINEDS
jgi:hypothetical protein